MTRHDKQLRRPPKRLPDTAQQKLFVEEDKKVLSNTVSYDSRIDFINPSPEKIFIGNERLRTFLENNDLGWVMGLREILEESDLTPFIEEYKSSGRKPFHPVIMMGIIVYGVLQRQWSLRELELLAKRDVGAWWLCGGRYPDHSTIGRFICRHSEILTEEYFINLTKLLVKKLKLSAGTVACDGTVIEAAASGYKTIKEEAAKEAADELRKKSEDNPQDNAAREAAEQAEAVARAAKDRADVLRDFRKDPSSIRVSPTEAEAVVQKTKKGFYRPSYKPSILANEEQMIVGVHVDPKDENNSVMPMLNQHRSITGALPRLAMFDAGYHNQQILGLSLKLDMDILCPAGNADRGNWNKKETKGKRLAKNQFYFDEENNIYVCPAGQKLKLVGKNKDRASNDEVRLIYRCQTCDGCELRKDCTNSKYGRTVYRYALDELKEAMVQVFKNEKARREYRQRKAIVEPVYARLRKQQGLERFHRRGLDKVRVEFSLHCLAYNIKKALGFERKGGFCLFILRYGANIRLIGLSWGS